MSKIKLIIQRADYADIISLLDGHIRSERARMAAFRGNKDYSNAYAAEGRRDQLLKLRNAFIAGCDSAEVIDD